MATQFTLDPVVAAAMQAIQDAKVVPGARVESFSKTVKFHLADGRTLRVKLVKTATDQK